MQFIEQADKHQKRHFWIQTLAFTKAKGSRAIQSLMCARTSNLLKHFNTGTSPRATHQESKKASSKAKLWDLSEQTLLKIYFKTLSKILNHAYVKGPSQNRKLALLQKPQNSKRILPFVTQYHPAATNLELETNPHKDATFNRPTTTAQGSLKNRPSYVIKKGGQSNIYSRETNFKTERLKHALGSRIGLSPRCIAKLTTGFNKVGNTNRFNYYSRK